MSTRAPVFFFFWMFDGGSGGFFVVVLFVNCDGFWFEFDCFLYLPVLDSWPLTFFLFPSFRIVFCFSGYQLLWLNKMRILVVLFVILFCCDN